jgi:hypothetical protein
MAKKMLTFLLAMVLLLSLFPAQAKDAARAETISQLNDLVTQYLDINGYNYDYNDNIFSMQFEMDSALGSSDVRIFVYYDMVSVTVSPPIRVKEEYRDLMAKYLTLANYECFYSQFRMDYSDGQVLSRSYVLVESVLPGMEELEVLLHMPLNDMDDFGDGLAQVALIGADPQVAFDETMAKLGSE